jgi:hypothetical protein
MQGLKTREDAQDMMGAITKDLKAGCQTGLEMRWVWGRK